MSNRKKILLVSLLNSTDNVGVKYPHSSLRNKGYASSILFYTSEAYSYCNKISEFINQERFNIIGISLMSRFFFKAAGLTETIKKECADDIPIIWGGVHPTIDYEGSKKYADYVCVGEVENTFDKFIDNLDGKHLRCEVQGFNYKVNPEEITASIVDDLDALPFPEHIPSNSYVTDNNKIRKMDMRLFKKHSRYGGTYLSVMSTRGCPFDCSFCSNSFLKKIYGRKIRKRSPQSTIEEIQRNLAQADISFNYIDFVDDCFTVHSNEWLRSFVDGYAKIGIPVVFRAIPQFVTEQKIKVLKDAPCGFAFVGLQSGSERINTEIYNRRYSRGRFLECANILHSCKIPAIYDVIVDNPYETDKDLEKTIEVINALPNSSYIFYYSLTFYKNTQLYKKAKENGYDVDSHLAKSQASYNESSKESKVIRLAVFFPKSFVKRLLYDETILGRSLLLVCTVAAKTILEPFRFLKLAYLSQQGRKRRLIRLLLCFSKQFYLKIYQPSESR